VGLNDDDEFDEALGFMPEIDGIDD